MDLKKFLISHPELVKDKNKLQSGLLDTYPNEKRAVRLIVFTYESGIAKIIANSKYLDEPTVKKLLFEMVDNYGLQEQFALEGIRYWADCFGKKLTYTIKSSTQTVPIQKTPSTSTPKTVLIQQNTPNFNIPQPMTSNYKEYQIEKIDAVSVRITKYVGFGGDVVIPSLISDMKVTEIGNKAFYNNISITSLTIPNTISVIDEEAFRRCAGLQNTVIPSSVKRIGDRAFAETGFGGFGSVTIPGCCAFIGAEAFRGCNIKMLTIQNGVDIIERHAFGFCLHLAVVTIPSSVTRISRRAFYGCNNLVSVTISNGVAEIGVEAFRFCSKLSSVVIPDSVNDIGDYAFDYNTELYCNLGSYALQYANDHGISAKPIT